jgi:CTP:molybdopterin cytidylyltransferase MocA
MTVGAILLAAGSARRMGEDKLLADLGGQPLIEHGLDSIRAARLEGPVVAVVPGSPLIARLSGKVMIVEVADHALGMGHSLAAAIGTVPTHWSAVIVCLADMPFVRAETLAALAGKATTVAVLRPGFEGKPGNPVLWGREHFAVLGRLTGDQGGRDLLVSRSVELVACGDPGVLIDVDTPEALEQARKRFR